MKNHEIPKRTELFEPTIQALSVTPDNQTILGVLEDIAVRVGEDSWRLKEAGQGNLFDLV